MNFLVQLQKPFASFLIVIIKLLVIMGDNTVATSSSLSQRVINSAQDINQQLLVLPPHAAALSSASASSISIPTSKTRPAAMHSANSLRLRKRHRKRHSIWFDNNNAYNENSTILEWSNPCGGEYNPNATQPERPNRKEQKRIYNKLIEAAINDFSYLNGSHKQEIDIRNIEIWWLHNGTYKFLPKLKLNSSIALKRWYRNMQTYVASFAYLHRIQIKYDRSKSQTESNTSKELKELLKSSTNMLCELETGYNKTYPVKKREIHQTTRSEMNKRLKLRTKQRFKDNPNILAETDSIDLKFVKFYYFEYLKHMSQLLQNVSRRRAQREHLKMKKEKVPISGKLPGNTPRFNLMNRNQTKRNKRRRNRKPKQKLG